MAKAGRERSREGTKKEKRETGFREGGERERQKKREKRDVAAQRKNK